MKNRGLKKITIISVASVMLLAACMSTTDTSRDMGRFDLPEGMQPIDIDPSSISYSGTTYSDAIGIYDLTNYDIAVANGAIVKAGDTLATSKDAALVEEEIALNNEKIALTRSNIQKLSEQRQAIEDYRATLNNEMASLEQEKNAVESQLQTNADPNVRFSLEGKIQMLSGLIESKRGALANQGNDGQQDRSADLKLEIANLTLMNKKRLQETRITALKDGIVKLTKDNKLQLVGNDSFVKINISEKELSYFKPDMNLTCRVAYLNEEVACSFISIDDAPAQEGPSGPGGGAANPFNVSIKLAKKYYNNVSVDVSFKK